MQLPATTRRMRSGRRAGGSQRAQTLRHVDRHEATDTDCALAQKCSIAHSKRAVGMAGFEPAASCSQISSTRSLDVAWRRPARRLPGTMFAGRRLT